MASTKGRNRSFGRYQVSVFRMQARSASRTLNRTIDAEHSRQLVVRPQGPHETAAAEFLLDCLLSPEVKSGKAFAIGWHPLCEWAKGPSILPFANIFDRFVSGIWNVQLSDDVDGDGQPGWVFTRV